MNDEQIKDKLQELFLEHRVVFWNDGNREFEEFVSALSMDGIEVLRPDRIGQFKTKVLIEMEQPEQKFIVYAPSQEPRHEDDWLLDIRLYSHQFRADRSSMIVEELGLQHHFLREHIGKRIKFFNSKERLERLKKRVIPSDLETELDRKMMAVLVRSEGDSFFDIVNTLFSAFSADGGIEVEPAPWQDIVKFGLEDAFWQLAKEQFGYEDGLASLQKLLCCLFITDLFSKVGDDIGGSLQQYLLPPSKQANAVVCLNNWRDSMRLLADYDRVAYLVEDLLDIEKHIPNIPHHALTDAVTFVAVEKAYARHLKEIVLAGEDPFDAEEVRKRANKRQGMYWAIQSAKDTQYAPRSALYAVYEAVAQAAGMIKLKKSYHAGFSFSSPKEGFERYTRELYQFDRAYRRFCESAARAKSWDVLKELEDRIEDIYANSFLNPLASAWESAADLSAWRIDGICNQYDFWGRFPSRDIGERSAAVYVVVSDAFRYEAATELVENLNSKYRFTARLNAMLGCVPSYTALGMAALLPHEHIDINEKGSVILDGKSCASMQQRSKILEQHDGMAVGAVELMNLSRNEARERMRGKDIVYVYHNAVDSVGDDSKTEGRTFLAVRDAIDELGDIVSHVVNTLNPRCVYVTADHGFVYTQQKPDDLDRKKIDSDTDFVINKKRYAVAKHIPDIADVNQGAISDTSGVDENSEMRFLIPRGMALFHFVGGARFFHGGMSLQEVVVPVIKVEEVRGKDKEKTREKSVRVQVLGTDNIITTGRHRFEFLQVESVSERVKPLTVKIGIYDDNTAVSDIHTVTFESASDDISQRKKEATFILQNVTFDRKKTYRLILRDAATDKEIQSVPVRIERAFTEDF